MRSDYTKLSEKEKAEFVKNKYDGLDGTRKYATSRDWNLRELEINFIIKTIMRLKYTPKILDIGCGNGYTDIALAKAMSAEIMAVDFSESMIEGANFLKAKHKDKLLGSVMFCVGDIRKLVWKNGFFDVVVSERCLLNLPDRKTQFNVIHEVHRVLKKGGIYIMVEGTRDGLRRLNELRTLWGLKPIPDKAKDNVQSLKFVEFELEEVLRHLFLTVKKQYFGMYYLISRVVHPLLVAPNEPKFDAKINEIARKMAQVEPDYKRLGHIVGYVLQKL